LTACPPLVLRNAPEAIHVHREETKVVPAGASTPKR